MSTDHLLLGCLIITLLNGLLICFFAWVLLRHIQRYDRLKGEIGAITTSHQDLLANHESRLQRMGSPGSRVLTVEDMLAETNHGGR